MTLCTDPSCRFVLPEDAPYLRNMAALWAVDARLAGEIEAMEGEGSYHVEAAKAGGVTVAVKTGDGRVQYLHSKYQPVQEAKRLIDSVKVEECVAFYLQGMGLGYHLEELFERASEEAIFCVLEPDLLLLRTALEQRDLSRLIESRRVLFFWRCDKAELFFRLGPHSALLTLGFEAVAHPPSVQIHSEFHRQMQTWISEFVSYTRTNINTLLINGRRTAENISRNLAWYAAAPGVGRLKDRYKGMPAVVVSAGPSLRKNKHLLKGLEDKAVLVAVQTTLMPLLEMGIEPHFVTSLDYHDVSTRFFEKLPRTIRTELVAEPKATSKIFGMYPGRLTVLGNDFAEGLLAEMKLGKPTLRAGATVAHLAYYLAEHMGCDPILFVGQDLGFSDGLYYLPGTAYEDVWRPELSRFCTVEMKQWEQIVRERPIMRKIPDYQGRPMYTEERLFSYLQQFERDFSAASARIIDASEGGAMKRGATPMKLAEAIERYCTKPLPVVTDDHPGLRWDLLDECVKSLRQRIQEAGEMHQISQQTLPLLEEIRDHLEDQGRVNRAIARIDALRARMNTLHACYDMVVQLTQQTELQRFHRDRRITAMRAEGLDRQRRQVERDIENVRAVIEAAKAFQQMMDEAIGNVLAAKEKTTREGRA